MKTSQYLLVALASIAFAACTNDNDPQSVDAVSPVEALFSGVLTDESSTSSAWTRAESGSEQETWSAPYLSIGISATSITGTNLPASLVSRYANYYNLKYTTSSSDVTASFIPAADTIYFQSSNETVTFAAYSPYDSALPTSGTEKGILSVKADASTHNVTDYIWAQVEGATYKNNTVSFAFTHKQAKLRLNVALDESVSLPDATTKVPSVTIQKVKVAGIVSTGTFNTETGVSATATDATATDIVTTYDSSTAASTHNYEYILIPQTIAANGFILTVTTSDGNIYKKIFTSATTFSAGYVYTYNITARKYAVDVESTITAWTEVTKVDGDASMVAE